MRDTRDHASAHRLYRIVHRRWVQERKYAFHCWAGTGGSAESEGLRRYKRRRIPGATEQDPSAELGSPGIAGLPVFSLSIHVAASQWFSLTLETSIAVFGAGLTSSAKSEPGAQVAVVKAWEEKEVNVVLGRYHDFSKSA